MDTLYLSEASDKKTTAAFTADCDASALHRRADDRDLMRDDFHRRREREARSFCLERIRHHGLPMKLVKVENAFEAGKVIFYFFSERRVDFRELVRDLAQSLRVRIEMKQIGTRDEAKLIGGIGSCGRELCCSTWLKEFAAVSVKMAKDQGLSLNPSKLAGQCGRLKCCLRYEYETYQEMGKNLPAVGTAVMSVKGDGRVTCQSVLKQMVMIRRDEDGIEVEATLTDLVKKREEP